MYIYVCVSDIWLGRLRSICSFFSELMAVWDSFFLTEHKLNLSAVQLWTVTSSDLRQFQFEFGFSCVKYNDLRLRVTTSTAKFSFHPFLSCVKYPKKASAPQANQVKKWSFEGLRLIILPTKKKKKPVA